MSESEVRLRSLTPYQAFFGRPVMDVLTDLEQFCENLARWQKMQNLVSRETVADAWDRHILDSLQLLPLMDAQLSAKTAANIVDIGSGGGFPALPLAIALKDRPITVHMIESRSRKCAFLKAIARNFRLSAKVHTQRIEDVDRSKIGGIAALTARALAPMPLLFSYLVHFWGLETKAFLHKGREYGEELRQADSVWTYDVVKHLSKVDPQGVILEISSLDRVA